MSMLVCVNEIRFCFAIKSLPVLCQLQLLLPSAAEGLPSIWRGSVQYQSFHCPRSPFLLGSNPDHAAPSLTRGWVWGALLLSITALSRPCNPPCSQPRAGDGVKPLAAVKLSCCLGPRVCSSWLTYLFMGFYHLCQLLTLLI